MAEAAVYYYETEIDWKGEKDLRLGAGKLPVIGAGAPPEFKGREENWSPEHLFVASLNTCYTLTLLAIAEFSKIALVSVSSTAKGKLEKVQGGGFQITEIVVKPRVVLASVNDLVRMVLLRAVRRGDHRVDSRADSGRSRGTHRRDRCYGFPVGRSQTRRRD